MTKVVSLFGSKDEETATGKARCIDCSHEWEAVVELPYDSSLECPSCGLSRGGFKYPMAPNEEAVVYKCNCECNHFWVLESGILCVGCGASTSFSELCDA